MIVVPIFTVLLSLDAVRGEASACEERCTRLKQRSLQRIGYDDERLDALFERQRPLESLKDVCWRVYDNLDCMKKCPKSEAHQKFAKLARNKCKFVLQDIEPTLKCISKHHAFLTTRCSSFLNEASNLRADSDLSTTPTHEVCRFLHLNTLCLENHVNAFCKNAKPIYRRLNFRDYFLSFVLPMDDDLFDDEDLDSCQIFDFVRDADKRRDEEEERRREEARRRRIEDDDDDDDELTTIVNRLEEMEEEATSTQAWHPDEDTVAPLGDVIDTGSTPEATTGLPSEGSTPESTTELTSEGSAPESTTGLTSEGSSQSSTLSADDKAEFTSLIDELIDSAERDQTTTTITTTMASTPIDDYDDYEDVLGETPTISVVAIETRSSTETTTTAMDEMVRLTPPIDGEKLELTSVGPTTTTTTKKKLFSDDSMEETPPNFFYSSMRYDTTTRSNYVVENMDKSESNEPLEIDTTTLFGIDETSDITESPWLQGGVVIKPILKFDEIDEDSVEERERAYREKLRNLTLHEFDDDHFDENSGERLEAWIGAVLIAIVGLLIVLILVLFVSYFRSNRTETYQVQKHHLPDV
ncbi:unnamed protein product [Caenorhabditis bovis]|uniref:Chondroitin proteoglycan 4 domain-containing protein n=1 Tax=Caenorhabditis bovis TaxID=2654633 RepID=A0A8S1F986_9PELO|nr:unnamed protein product [Caenorhabditis bovis]